MRSWISIVGAGAIGALLVAGALRTARTMRFVTTDVGVGAGAIGRVRPATAPAVWVFVRPGCARCVAHLEALETAWRTLPAEESARLAGRLQIVGACRRLPHGAERLPDSVAAPHVPLVPTTWIWNARGEVVRVWRGVRGAPEWTPVLRQLAAREAA